MRRRERIGPDRTCSWLCLALRSFSGAGESKKKKERDRGKKFSLKIITDCVHKGLCNRTIK